MIKDEKDYSVPALKKGLEVLGMFDKNNKMLSVAEIANRINSTSSAIYRTIYTLESMGYLVRDEGKSYRLGSEVLSLGFHYLANEEVTEVAGPLLKKLRDATSCTCHLAIRSGAHIVYQYRAQSKQQLVTNFPVGSRMLAHRSAMGRVLLSHESAEKISQLYENISLDDHPEPTPKSILGLIEMLKKDASQKYVLHSSHNSQAIAAPVVNVHKECIAAINVSSPDIHLNEANDELIKHLINCAKDISKQFGNTDYFDDIKI